MRIARVVFEKPVEDPRYEGSNPTLERRTVFWGGEDLKIFKASDHISITYGSRDICVPLCRALFWEPAQDAATAVPDPVSIKRGPGRPKKDAA